MSVEVRRCSRCNAPAAVCIRDWAITTYGIPSGRSTRDFCCQECGYRFTLESKMRIIVYGVMSVIFLIACLGVVTGVYTAYLAWPWLRNPIVPNAPSPPMRFRATEPLRLCTKCQGSARCTAVVRKSVNLVPTGTTYTYVCMTCSKSFEVDSIGGIFFLLFAGTVMSLLGIATIMVSIGVLFLLLGLIGYGFAAFGIWRLMTNKVLPEHSS